MIEEMSGTQEQASDETAGNAPMPQGDGDGGTTEPAADGGDPAGDDARD